MYNIGYNIRIIQGENGKENGNYYRVYRDHFFVPLQPIMGNWGLGEIAIYP